MKLIPGKKKINEVISEIYYKCPVCGRKSTSESKIERHLRQHHIKTEEIVYCTICGAGWYVEAYGRKTAYEMAKECYKRHFVEGDADQIAGMSFFLSKGTFGYVRIYEGRKN